ncbi:MAG: sigma-70 family RNA polymerase sigma factor [bacterium]|nr:sigma-70 family RNA polymerase sigma factor [bacterium]
MGQEASKGVVTRILDSLQRGEAKAAEELLPIVYAELRRQAGRYMASLAPGQTLQSTALVHEAYLELVGKEDPGWQNRAHFYGAAARAMREILIDQARRKASMKHGGHLHRIGCEGIAQLSSEGPTFDVLAIDEALRDLERADPRAAELVMLRFFGGLSMPEAAEILGVSTATAFREWRFAKAWLQKELRGSADSG